MSRESGALWNLYVDGILYRFALPLQYAELIKLVLEDFDFKVELKVNLEV